MPGPDPAFQAEWRGGFDNTEVNSLHAEGFSHPPGRHDWSGQVRRHSLGWVCVRRRSVGEPPPLAGFVNVAWDGGVHAFLLDTVVGAGSRRQGIGTMLLRVAIEQVRAAGCEWLHVDFEEHLRPFYLSAGFSASGAGVLQLKQPGGR
jgi:GNAT superfamily N-acetyltransferase